jgi:putative chitinase
MKFDKDRLLFAITGVFGELNNKQKNGLLELVFFIESDENISDIRWIAYMLGTTWHETAYTLQPIEEYGRGRNREYGIVDSVTGKVYFGRGYVQLTWKSNYKTMGSLCNIDLVNNPSLALMPKYAYMIMSIGMRKGLFTGVGLKQFLNNEKWDYLNARKIINGLDCASKIAGYAVDFEKALRDSVMF